MAFSQMYICEIKKVRNKGKIVTVNKSFSAKPGKTKKFEVVIGESKTGSSETTTVIRLEYPSWFKKKISSARFRLTVEESNVMAAGVPHPAKGSSGWITQKQIDSGEIIEFNVPFGPEVICRKR
jgi:hypothetical protein